MDQFTADCEHGKKGVDMKPKIRVVDVPSNAPAEEVERLLNGPCEDGYYSDKIVFSGLPEGVGVRGYFKLRMKAE